MKVLIMNWRDATNPSAGGAELVTHEIARRWVRWGNEVRLITSKYPSAISEENIGGLIVTRIGGKYSVYAATAYRFLKEYSRSYDVIVDQINSIPFLTPLYCRVPIVPFVFQMSKEIYNSEIPLFLSSLAMRLEPLLLRLYAKCPTIVLSNSTKNDLVSIGFRPEQIFVCPPGVDHQAFSPSKKTSYPSILYMNRFARYKNPAHLVISFKKILSHIPNCKLTMAGARNADEIHYLKGLANSLGVHSVEILPFIHGSPKIELLAKSWVHVLPSIREGWGISILEAAACRTPTVGYDVPGVRDAVQHAKTGLLVRYGCIDSLAGAICTLLQNDALRKRLSAECVSLASKFSWDFTAKEAMRAITCAVAREEANGEVRFDERQQLLGKG